MKTHKPDSIKPQKSIKVWDLPIRVFHWSLVSLIIICLISIKQSNVTVHQYAGIGILVLVIFRIIWGFIGSKTARFSDFIPSPTAILKYLKTQKSPTEGHNPLGAGMVLLLLFVLLVQTSTGLFLEDNTYIAQDSPFAELVSSEMRGRLTSIHQWGEIVLYATIGLHICAGLAYLLIKKQNLIKTMITGKRKHSELHTPDFKLSNDKPILALVLFIALALIAYLIFFYPPTASALINLLNA